MAIHVRKDGEWRVCLPDSDVPTCNTCGGSAPVHIFRPAFLYRCVACVETFGKNQTMNVEGIVQISEGIGHIGIIADVPL